MKGIILLVIFPLITPIFLVLLRVFYKKIEGLKIENNNWWSAFSYSNKKFIPYIFYVFAIFLFLLSLWGTLSHHPSFDELQHVSGSLISYSIKDGFRNHEIKMKLDGIPNTFKFKKVDFFPALKEKLPSGGIVDFWVEKKSFHLGKSPQIWDLSINGQPIMTKDSISTLLRERAREGLKHAAYVFIFALLSHFCVSTKNKFISDVVYPSVLVLISLGCIFGYFYLVANGVYG